MRAPPSTCQPFALSLVGRARSKHLLLDAANNHIVWLCGNDPFDEVRQLGGLLTLKQPRVAVEDLQFGVEILLGLALDVGDGLDPESLYGFHSKQLAVASEGHSLIQHILEESVLVADVSSWWEALLHGVQDLCDGAKAAELRKRHELDQARLRRTGQLGGACGRCRIACSGLKLTSSAASSKETPSTAQLLSSSIKLSWALKN